MWIICKKSRNEYNHYYSNILTIYMSFSLTPKLGIDLGTTYTLIYVPGKGVVLREPSVVAVSEQENKKNLA